MTPPSPQYSEGLIETAERIVIDYANFSGRESANRAEFRENVIKHLTTFLAQREQEIHQRLDEWAENLWAFNVLTHEEWTGPDEVAASIMSYIEGKHLSPNTPPLQ